MQHYRLLTAIVGLAGVIHAAGSVGTEQDFPGVDLESHVQSGNVEAVPDGAVSSGASGAEIVSLQRTVADLNAEIDGLKADAARLTAANADFGARWDVMTAEEKAEIEKRVEGAQKADLQRAALGALTVDELRKMAKFAGVSPIPEKKAELVEAMIAASSDPAVVEKKE